MTPTRNSASTPTQSHQQKQQTPSPATPTTNNVVVATAATSTTTPQTEYSTMTPIPGQLRKNSLGPLRRAHPASGATWNVEVIRGKMTSRCLWHACRALVLGMILMILGAGMATIGYYAVPLTPGQVEKNNSTSTAFIKNISRGYHLNNLSYIGPIVMGFGGFIVVAACVMTFEARDSAAKVVPARFKMGTVSTTSVGGGSGRARNSSGIRRGGATGAPNGPSSVGSQTTTARDSGAPFRASSGDKYVDRQALTAALIHFSRALGTPGQSPSQSRRMSRVSRSGSVPNLHGEFSSTNCMNGMQSPNKQQSYASKGVSTTTTSGGFNSRHHHHHSSTHYHSHRNQGSGGHHRRGNSSRHSSLTQRNTREQHSDRYLHPAMLKYHRHAVSVDESHPPPYLLRPILSNSHHHVVGSQPTISSTMVHSTSPTHEASSLRHIKRSDTARQHVLARQRNIEKEEQQQQQQQQSGGMFSPKAMTTHSYYSSCGGGERRRSSTASDASMASRHTTCARRASTSSRTPSIDSRYLVHGQCSAETANGSVEGIPVAGGGGGQGDVKGTSSPRSWRVSAQISTPSVEKEFRSQLSICSEPAIATTTSPKALSCQSSIEPCVPEEESPAEEDNKPVAKTTHEDAPATTTTTTKHRPDTLILECPLSPPEPVVAVVVPGKYLADAKKSTSFKRKRPAKKVVQKNASVGEIYFISAAATTSETEQQNQDYDSIEVIDERRNKNFGVSSSNTSAGNGASSGIITSTTNLERTDTVIYREKKNSSSSVNVGNTCLKDHGIVDEEEGGEREGFGRGVEVASGNGTTTMTIMAEIEKRRSSNTATDSSDGGVK